MSRRLRLTSYKFYNSACILGQHAMNRHRTNIKTMVDIRLSVCEYTQNRSFNYCMGTSDPHLYAIDIHVKYD